MAVIQKGDRVRVKGGDGTILNVLSVSGDKAGCGPTEFNGKEYLLSELELVAKGGPIRPLRPTFG